MQKLLTYSLLALLTFALSTSAYAGKVYKWTDAAGNTIYSQTPPPSDKKAEEMDVKAPKPSSAPAKISGTAGAAQGEKKQAENKETDDKAVKEQQAKNDEIRKENCNRANTRMRTISAGGRIYEVNEQGERVYWDEATMKAKTEEAQKAVDEWCK